jgi:hypothetical protein
VTTRGELLEIESDHDDEVEVYDDQTAYTGRTLGKRAIEEHQELLSQELEAVNKRQRLE